MGIFDSIIEKVKKVLQNNSPKESYAKTSQDGEKKQLDYEKKQLDYTLSSDFEVNELGDGTVEVGTYIGFDCENLLIAAEINGKKVRGVGKIFPEECSTIKNIKLSEGIEYIADEAFMNCDNIETVILPESMTSLGERAFSNSGLISIEIPDSVKTIGKACFKECIKLDEFVLPQNFEVLEEEIFYGCTYVTSGTLPDNLRIVKARAFSGCGIHEAFDFDFRNDSGGKCLEILEDGAFSVNIFSSDPVVLPPSLTYIGDSALEGIGGFECDKLFVPATVKHLGAAAFQKSGCKEIYFEKGFSCPLSYATLGDCYNLEAVHIPASVTQIDENLFKGEKITLSLKKDVYDEQGFRAHNRDGSLKYDYEEEVSEHEISEDLIIYCEPGSAAMQFARKHNIHCEPYKPFEN